MLLTSGVRARLHAPIDHRALFTGHDAATDLLGDLFLATDASLSNPAMTGMSFFLFLLVLLHDLAIVADFGHKRNLSATFEEIRRTFDGARRKTASRSTRHFPPNLSRRLIVSQSDEDSVAEQRLVGPTKIGDLGDEYGPHPMHFRQGQRASESAPALWR